MIKKWTQSEIDFLKNNYSNGTLDSILMGLPGRTLSSIHHKAERNKIIRRKSNEAYKLLNESLQSYYWLGFLFADGHFTDLGGIILKLSEKDHNHVQKFANFVKGNVYKNSHCLSTNGKLYTQYHTQVNSVEVMSKLREKFNITSNKTYNPVKLDTVGDNDKITAMIIGIIDGDGCIRITKRSNTPVIAIKMHKSWVDNLCYLTGFISNQIDADIPLPKIDKRGMVQVNWCNRAISRMLKSFIAKHDLEVLDRKWDAIKVLPFSLSELKEADFVNIKQMHNDGLSVDQIASVINTCHDSIYKIIKNK